MTKVPFQQPQDPHRCEAKRVGLILLMGAERSHDHRKKGRA